MKPWMWAALGIVVVIVIGGLLWMLSGSGPPSPEPAPPRAADTEVPAAPDPPPEAPPELTTPPPETIPSSDDTDAEEPDTGPDLTPEDVDRAAFDEVFDSVIEECGLGAWSELQRDCTDWRCLALIAAPVEPAEAAPNVDSIVNCPSWTESWGKHPDYWLFGAECPDGTLINISLLGPSTLRMRRGIDQGFIEEFQVDIDGARDQACSLWGK